MMGWTETELALDGVELEAFLDALPDRVDVMWFLAARQQFLSKQGDIPYTMLVPDDPVYQHYCKREREGRP